MSAQEALRAGDLDGALAQLQEEVRHSPADAKLRVFLFQLLAVQGQWERAWVQLNTAAEMEPLALAMAQMYRETLRCEMLRAEIFAGKRGPLIFGEPPAWIGWLVEALRWTAEGQYEAANQLRERAFEAAPAVPGSINGQRFQWLADADPRLGPVLEAIVAGRYLWIPFQHIRSIRLEAPADLRDMVWMPAQFTWVNGGEAVGVLPSRYPGSESNPDPLIRLARKTDWQEVAPGLQLGQGQRLLATDEDDFPLLDIRQLDCEVEDGGTHGS